MKTVTIKLTDYRFFKRWAIKGVLNEYYGGNPIYFSEGEQLVKEIRKHKPISKQ